MKVLRIRFQATRLSLALVYVVLIAAALLLAGHRLREPVAAAPNVAPAETPVDAT